MTGKRTLIRGASRLLVCLAMLATSISSGQSVVAADIDSATGLRVATNWELARAHCGVCHSYRLVTANRGDRGYWLDTLRWMQRTQNLWPIPEDQETKLLDYLAANYNETDWGRRPPLSPSLLPSAPKVDATTSGP